MQPTSSISKLLNYIYVLLAAAGILLSVVTTFLILQGSRTSQEEQMLSRYLLPTIFDLQRLDREIIDLQRMHSISLQDLNAHHTATDIAEKEHHILITHVQPIQRFIKKINDINRQSGIHSFQSAMDRLNKNHQYFESSLAEFFETSDVDANMQALTESIAALNVATRQITRLYQREANTLINNLNDRQNSGAWYALDVIIFAVVFGALIAVRIILLTKAAIARQQASDAELRQHKDHLEELVRERTSNLELTNKELHSYSYSISHDLRAPVRAITSFSQILLTESSKKLNDEEINNLKRINVAGLHMAELIDDILELSTVTRSDLDRQKTDLSQIARRIVEQRGSSNPGQATDIRIQENIFANVDPKLIKLALEHLLVNAIKYSRNKPTAIIEFGTENINGETTYFVRDNGIGFDMQYAGKLFQAFERVQNKMSIDGSGIGLALVERVITKHGGRIWATAAINQGATFYFTLPENTRKTTNAMPLSTTH